MTKEQKKKLMDKTLRPATLVWQAISLSEEEAIYLYNLVRQDLSK